MRQLNYTRLTINLILSYNPLNKLKSGNDLIMSWFEWDFEKWNRIKLMDQTVPDDIVRHLLRHFKLCI